MDTVELVSFLGHSSIYEPFDEFLAENGIKRRPKKNEATEWISEEALGLSLEFEASDVYGGNALSPIRSDGRFILRSVTFGPNFRYSLPFGLTLAMSKANAEGVLGRARKERASLPSATFVHEGFVIVFNWNKEEPNEAFIRFKLPDIYDKEQLGL